jgi:hypothetical protein
MKLQKLNRPIISSWFLPFLPSFFLGVCTYWNLETRPGLEVLRHILRTGWAHFETHDPAPLLQQYEKAVAKNRYEVHFSEIIAIIGNVERT